MKAVFVIFDGPPNPVGPTFVEVEDEGGRSINIHDWNQRPDGLWSLGPFYVEEDQLYERWKTLGIIE